MNRSTLKLFNILPFKKVVSTITLTCFIITILYTSGFSSFFEKDRDQRRTPQAVYHRWATVAEQVQGRQLIEFKDKEKNQVYRFNKEGKLVEVEDKNKGVVFKYTYDKKGNVKVEVVDLREKKNQNVETSKENQNQHKQTELILAKAEVFTNKLLNAPPEKQQKMLESVGISVEEVKNLSKEEIKQKVIEYIQTNKNLPLGEVTVKQLTQNLQQLLDNTRNALTLVFTNLVRQFIGEKKKETEGEVLVSIEDIQVAAEKQGIKLNSAEINFKQLKEVLESSPAIVYLKGKDGKGLFLIVTDIKDDKVIGIDANGKKTVIMGVNEFLFKWSGKTLSVANIGEELDRETKENTKGTFFTKLFDNIKKVFTQQQLQQSIQQTTTQTSQTEAQQVISLIEQWLNEYINADPAKKALMAAQLGLSVDQLANLSAETVKQIIDYLKSQDNKIFNCAIQALAQILGSGTANLNKLVFESIIIDILTGVLRPGSNSMGEQLQLSMFAIQQTAKLNGIDLTGYHTTLEGLKNALESGQYVVARLDLGGGVGHFVNVTKIENGMVYYIDSDGSLKSMSLEVWNQLWDGNVLTTDQTLANLSGTTQLGQNQMMALVGSLRHVMSCFPAGTKVLMADGSQKNIEEIKIGDKIIGYDGEKNVVVEVIDLIAPLRDHIYRITFEDGTVLENTREHPLYTKEGWKSFAPKHTLYETNGDLHVGLLNVGDEVLTVTGKYLKIVKIEYRKGIFQTYNLKKISYTHNFYVNGLLTHNCGRTSSQQTSGGGSSTSSSSSSQQASSQRTSSQQTSGGRSSTSSSSSSQQASSQQTSSQQTPGGRSLTPSPSSTPQPRLPSSSPVPNAPSKPAVSPLSNAPKVGDDGVSWDTIDEATKAMFGYDRAKWEAERQAYLNARAAGMSDEEARHYASAFTNNGISYAGGSPVVLWSPNSKPPLPGNSLINTIFSTVLDPTKWGKTFEDRRRYFADVAVKIYAIQSGSWSGINEVWNRAYESYKEELVSVNGPQGMYGNNILIANTLFGKITLADSTCIYTNPDGTQVRGTLLAGARLSDSNEIIEGEFKFSGTIEITKKQTDLETSGGGILPVVKTNAVVIETEKSYLCSNGIVSIRNGNMVVIGIGATFKAGSSLGYYRTDENGRQYGSVIKVLSGSITLVGYDTEGNAIYTSAGGYATTSLTTKLIDETTYISHDGKRTITQSEYNKLSEAEKAEYKISHKGTGDVVTNTIYFNYNTNGVMSAYSVVLGKGQNLKGHGKIIEGRVLQYWQVGTTELNGKTYRVLARDKEGKLKSAGIYYDNVITKREVKSKVPIEGSVEDISVVIESRFNGWEGNLEFSVNAAVKDGKKEYKSNTVVSCDDGVVLIGVYDSTSKKNIYYEVNNKNNLRRIEGSAKYTATDENKGIRLNYEIDNRGELKTTYQIRFGNIWWTVDSLGTDGNDFVAYLKSKGYEDHKDVYYVLVQDKNSNWVWKQVTKEGVNGWKVREDTVQGQQRRLLVKEGSSTTLQQAIGSNSGNLDGMNFSLPLNTQVEKAFDGELGILGWRVLNDTQININGNNYSLLAGSFVTKGQDGNLVILDGGIQVRADQNLVWTVKENKTNIPAGDASLNDSRFRTTAIIQAKINSDGSITYSFSNGILRVRNNQLVPLHRGAVVLIGSNIFGTRVVEGNDAVVDFASDGRLVLKAKDPGKKTHLVTATQIEDENGSVIDVEIDRWVDSRGIANGHIEMRYGDGDTFMGAKVSSLAYRDVGVSDKGSGYVIAKYQFANLNTYITDGINEEHIVEHMLY